MIATHVPLFHEMCEMPLTFDPARLNESGGIEATLRRNVGNTTQVVDACLTTQTWNVLGSSNLMFKAS